MKKLSKKVRMAQRVEICKDVIAQLRAGQYQAKSGWMYIDADESDALSQCQEDLGGVAEVDAQIVVSKILGENCVLCQRGGLLLSAIRKFDDLQLTHGDQLHNEAMGTGDLKYLERWFTLKELQVLEEAFELDLEDDNHWAAVYSHDVDRMDAIMRNVIAHDGEFVPTDIPRPRRKPLSETVRGAR